MRAALKVLLLLAALLAITVATAPWWLGLALRPLGARFGLEFSAYERVGYTRFVVRDARFVRQGFEVRAQRVELDTPLLWLLHRSAARAEIARWQLILATAPPNRENRPAPSPARAHAQAQRVAAQLKAWLPRLHAIDGALVRQDLRFPIDEVAWDARSLRARGALPSADAFTLEVLEDNEKFAVALALPAFSASAKLQWTADRLAGEGTWWQQPFTLMARFGDRGWIPAQAEVRAPGWDLPASQLKLGASFARVRSDVQIDWRDGKFSSDLRAHATPTDRAQVPPLELAARATGDRSHVSISALQIDAPFARATLSAPLLLHFDGRAPAGPALLQIDADLARQPWIDAAGRITGQLRVAAESRAASGAFTFTVADARLGRVTAELLRLEGTWQDTDVTVSYFAARLDGHSRISARAALNWPRRELTRLHFEADIAGDWAQPWLPPGVSFARATLALEGDGPIEAPRHRGELHITSARANQLRPLALEARWQGQDRALQDFTLTARSGGAVLRAGGLLDERRVGLRSLSLTRAGREEIQLVAPAEITWHPRWQVSGLRLEGGDRALAADIVLGAEPRFFVSAQNLSSAWLVDWWAGKLPASRIDQVIARGDVRGAALAFETEASLAIEWEGSWIQGRLAATGNHRGAQISQLELADDRGLMAYASGQLPAWLEWQDSPRLRWDDSAPLEFDVSIAPDSPLWPTLADKARLQVEGASLVATASGTIREPRGLVRAEAERLHRSEASEAERDAAIDDLHLVLRAERDGLVVENLEARVAGQPVRATGHLPMDDAAWRALLQRPAEFDWSRASAELMAKQVELAALAETFPVLPFTRGAVEATVRFARGELHGSARLSGGETRPLPGLGRMLDVAADLSLEGRRVELRKFAARLGGEPVRLTGSAELSPRGRPVFDLRLEGRNVPLVRRPGLLVRTDVDLRAQTPERGPTRIGGRVDLRDALVMADLAAILPGGPRGAARHPPYFAVGTEPFSRWPLDVRIGGARAVRVRTAVFNGIATPNFHLTGTLGDPRAVGQLAVDEGRVLFPFASFAVQQGTVRLTEADPTQPQLAVNAVAKRMGYELRLEAGGTVAAPTLVFSSNPPLESAAILLLVTTGQPPADEMATPTGSQRLTRLGTFLGRGLFQNFGGEEQRLEITSGEQVSRAGRETYRVEYKLRDKLSLTGDYDEYDFYNAGIKYRIYTQEGAKREERK